jgi:excisionase family DNA binding protein
MEQRALLSVSQTARRIGVTRQRVHALIAHGQLRATRLGHYYFLEEEEVERYLSLPQGRPYAPRSSPGDNSVDKRQ